MFGRFGRSAQRHEQFSRLRPQPARTCAELKKRSQLLHAARKKESKPAFELNACCGWVARHFS